MKATAEVPAEPGELIVLSQPEEAARRRRPRLPFPTRSPRTQEERRERQRVICMELLKKWVPLATAEELALARELRGKPVVEEEAFETGLKAGVFVIRVLERLARLDGLDAAERKEVEVSGLADPLELVQRVRTVSPLLAARLAGLGESRATRAAAACVDGVGAESGLSQGGIT